VLMTHITMSNAIAMGLLKSILASSGSLLLGIGKGIKLGVFTFGEGCGQS
jgi:hypothetical protein